MTAAARGRDARLRRVRLVVCDVDGVLTDGTITLTARSGEGKNFSVLDGTGFALAGLAGLPCALLSGRRSAVVMERARECGVSLVVQGVSEKAPAFAALCRRVGVAEQETAYLGDDLIDLPVFDQAGLAIAPADARPEVRAQAHWVLRAPGGRGAVREAIEGILRAQDVWDRVLARYLRGDVAKA